MAGVVGAGTGAAMLWKGLVHDDKVFLSSKASQENIKEHGVLKGLWRNVKGNPKAVLGSVALDVGGTVLGLLGLSFIGRAWTGKAPQTKQEDSKS